MNKRMKKKYELENRIRLLEAHVDYLIYQNDQLQETVERNAQTTNSELTTITTGLVKFEERIGNLESDNETMRVDLDKGLIEFRKRKKAFWKR
ncbi:hypothetical protein HO543_01415 [Streptococcus suis]|nr:hypothetical protein [Streptococcus suis]NQJ76032.1 hypothetical protein [Streptococcus suis]